MTFQKNVTAGVTAALAALIAIGVLSYRTMMRSTADMAWVTHTHVVLEALGELQSAVTDAETGQRGFVITGDETYLEPYAKALETAALRLQAIRQLTIDNTIQQQRLTDLQRLIEARLATLDTVVGTRRDQGFEAAAESMRGGKGKREMDEIRAGVGAMEREEHALLAVRDREAQESLKQAKEVIIFGNGVSFLLLFGACMIVQREMARRKAADHLIRELNTGLELRVAERTAELSDRTMQLMRSNEDLSERTRELARSNEDLSERTKELARSNEELQQFAYVASHDLQEPLRMVASFTQLLAKRYNDKLGDDAREFIHYAVDGATRLQTLITDLLSYSRVGTHAKPLEPTDCDQVLDRVLAGLKLAVEDSKAVITRDRLPEVMADPVQMGQLLQNLLVNAMKFRGEKRPEIHIGARQENGLWKISVRDNGIGISPEHYERIWIIFQRLHTKTEYAGTGIGLAICKKIAERHGGKIWIEATPGGGSTFCFTIPVMTQETRKDERRTDELRSTVAVH